MLKEEEKKGTDNKNLESDTRGSGLDLKKVLSRVILVVVIVFALFYFFKFVVGLLNKGIDSGFETPEVQLN